MVLVLHIDALVARERFVGTVIPDGASPSVSNDLGPSGGSFLALLDPR